eukprot:2605932-Prymnesium_polylepis.1
MPSPATLVLGLIVCAAILHAASTTLFGASRTPTARGINVRTIQHAVDHDDDALELLEEQAAPKPKKKAKKPKANKKAEV